MPAMNISEITAVGMLLATLGAIFITQCNANKQNKQMLKQSRMSLFAEYTRRYQDIMARMPASVYSGQFDTKIAEVVGFMRLYFDLCSEEYWLNEEKMIPERTWSIWVEGMQTTMNQEPFKKAWDRLSGHYDEKFYRFFSKEIVERECMRKSVDNNME